jgi:hypothetical protein
LQTYTARRKKKLEEELCGHEVNKESYRTFEAKAVSVHATQALVGREGITPTHS